ncbi:hypothetical protein CAC42_6931 [Sphaceloma murrayae]|uniref:Transcription factor tau subunit sfc4 n=1 Tax=Sphaceloma murrayae TaxID=2082308 RepID=A0A2K1QQ72_9PEZI|nr:hypothetical protein CAC42_6931 [Sphaceloma murrayae]
MDNDASGSAYPDPESAYVSPYPQQYGSSHIARNNGPYGDPRTGGLWQAGPGPAPLIHEGFIPRDDHLGPSAVDGDDSEDDLQSLYAKFNLGPSSTPGDDFDISAIDQTVADGFDEDVLAGAFDLPDLDGNAPDMDSDFNISDAESDAAASIDSDMFDQMLDEEANFQERGRGRGRGRPRGRGRGRGRGKRGWKWALKGTEHDPDLEKRTRGRPRGRPRGRAVPRGEGRSAGRPTGPNRPADPGHDFKQFQAQAVSNYLAGDYETAASFARRAIGANPEVFAAHSLLSEILAAQGEAKDSLAALLAGAHTKRDAELWVHVGQKTKELSADTITEESLEAAIYCFSWAIRLNAQDYDARRERLNLLLQLYQLANNGHVAARARNECLNMLKFRPHDVLVAREYAELATISSNDREITKAKEIYDQAIANQPDSTILGPDPDEDEQWNHAMVYLGLVERLEGVDKAIRRFKHLGRLIQQRQEETFWDALSDDDREFDTVEERKVQVEGYRRLKEQQSVESLQARSALPLDMRIKLGLYRIALGGDHHEEAIRHFGHLLNEADSIAELADLFREVADVLRVKGLVEDAIRFYEPLQEVPDTLDTRYYTDLATCYISLNKPEDAEECYKIVIENTPEDWEAKVALAKLYESQDRRDEALPLITDIIRDGRQDALKKSNITIPRKEIRAEQRKRNAELQREADEVENAAILRQAREAAKHSMIDEVILDLGTEEQLELREELTRRGRQKKALAPISGSAEATIKTPRARLSKKIDGKPGAVRVRRIGISSAALERQSKLNEQMRTLKSATDRVQSNYDLMKSCEADMAAGDLDAIAIWKSAVNNMLDEFKDCKYHYPTVKEKHQRFQGYGRQTKLMTEMEAMRDRLAGEQYQGTADDDDTIPTKFHDIPHTTWLDFFCAFALQLAREGEMESCYGNIDNALGCSVFYHSETAVHQLQTTTLACALLFNDEARIASTTRHFMSAAPHATAPYDIFATAFRLHIGPSTWFNAGPTQKYLMRAVKSFDFHVLPDDQRRAWHFNTAERTALTFSGRKIPGYPGLPDLNPSVLTIYGHVMAATQTWPGALNYYFRALALRPGDPTLLLCIGTAYVMGAMKRQAENRHWMIMQGLGFLGRYKRSRKRSAEEKGRKVYEQEAEFNVARAWHFLGLTHLAVKAYRRCLAMQGEIEAQRREGMDVDGEMQVEEYTQEAALGLINIYVTTEQVGRARELAERYLVI